MPCQHVTLPGGQRAIVCSPRQPRRKCVACGKPADQLCDWKIPAKQSGTCDKPVCAACTHSPAPDKDLCPAHAAEWQERQAQRRD